MRIPVGGGLFSPTQAFFQQDLAHAAALDGDVLVLVQVGGQPVQAPATIDLQLGNVRIWKG
jgi:hypothetical protein